MSTLIITRGLPASGKTTWAREWVAESPGSRSRVNRDDLREMLFQKPDYSHAQETAVTAAARAAVKALLHAGRDVVADDTNLRPRYVREWARFAYANGAELEVKEFPIHPDEAVERDAARDRTVGEDVIRRMVQKYLPGVTCCRSPMTPPRRPGSAGRPRRASARASRRCRPQRRQVLPAWVRSGSAPRWPRSYGERPLCTQAWLDKPHRGGYDHPPHLTQRTVLDPSPTPSRGDETTPGVGRGGREGAE